MTTQMIFEDMLAATQSLYGKYAQTAIDLDKETLDATIDEAATAWKTELDEFPVTADSAE